MVEVFTPQPKGVLQWTSRIAVAAAVVLGVAGGSYGVASAANGSGSTTTTTTTPSAPSAQRPWGGQRNDETPLTGDALTKVTAAAEAKVSGGTVIRVETDADDNAKYEAHMTKADGTPVTVYMDEDFNVVGVDSGGPGGMPHSTA